jgi:hypothetical protein
MGIAEEGVGVRCPERVGLVLSFDRTRLLPYATANAEAMFARLLAAGYGAVGHLALYPGGAHRVRHPDLKIGGRLRQTRQRKPEVAKVGSCCEVDLEML